MSIDKKDPGGNSPGPARLEVLCDADTGHVFAARELDLWPREGDDAPDRVVFVPDEKQICEEVELTAEQMAQGLPKLFGTHRLEKRKLVLKAAGK